MSAAHAHHEQNQLPDKHSWPQLSSNNDATLTKGLPAPFTHDERLTDRSDSKPLCAVNCFSKRNYSRFFIPILRGGDPFSQLPFIRIFEILQTKEFRNPSEIPIHLDISSTLHSSSFLMEFHKLKSKNKKNRKIRPRISIMLCRFCLSLRIGEREKKRSASQSCQIP